MREDMDGGAERNELRDYNSIRGKVNHIATAVFSKPAKSSRVEQTIAAPYIS